jgi:hypothetical protein
VVFLYSQPESAGSGGGESKDFESGEDEEIGVGEEDGDTMMSGMESRSSSPVSEDGEGDRKRSRGLPRSIKSITLDELRLYFDKPIEEAAKMIGICSTLLKKICRKYNIKRWPYRQVRAIPFSTKAALGSFRVRSAVVVCKSCSVLSFQLHEPGHFTSALHYIAACAVNIYERCALLRCTA